MVLKGNQKKLDANKDGKISKVDFKVLQNKKNKNKNIQEFLMKGVPHYLPSGKVYKGKTHKMKDGTLHSGATHTKSSKKLTHKKPKKAKA